MSTWPSYTNIKLIAAYLLKIDPPSLETKGFLALLAAYSISLTGLSATSLWIWYIHRRSTFAKIQREEGLEEEEKPNEQGKQEKTKPGAFGEERQAISTFFKTTIAVIIIMFIYLILGADIDKLEVITFWPIALEPSTDWL